MTAHDEPGGPEPGWHIRAFTQEDVRGIAALFDAADRADQLYKLSSEDDIEVAFGDSLSSATTRVIVAVAPSRTGTRQTRVLGAGRVSASLTRATRWPIYWLS